VIGIDWRTPIGEARRRLGGRFAIQGNLDPYVMTAPWSEIEQQAKRIIDQGIEQPGYIFNLGHGLFPEASLEKLKQLTDFVHTYSQFAISQRREGKEVSYE
jgi:uroporphyrinogen decarboxylase